MPRCSLCPGVHQCLSGSGPRGRLLFIGEAPGKEEERRGSVFVGKTGQEVNDHFLPLAGLQRSQVRMVNAISCLPNTPKGKLDPKRRANLDLLDACASANLLPELTHRGLQVIIPMGTFACRVLDDTIDLKLHHGIPRQTAWGTVFPMYHPAVALHEPKKMLQIRTDWIRLRKFLQGLLPTVQDAHPQTDYREAGRQAHVNLDPLKPIAIDTEDSRSLGPYCVTYSQQPGTGWLIRSDRTNLLRRFNRQLQAWRSHIYIHNWGYDVAPLTAMGVHVPLKRLRDTMVMSFHLGNLPQALKELAYRELGMTMQDFEDLVVPYSAPLVLNYYKQAQALTWPKPDPTTEINPKTGLWETYQPQSLNTKLKRFFTDLSKNPEKDVFQMWTKNWVDLQMDMEAALGPWPGIDIAHVPFDKVLHYACRDADATLRIAAVLQQMRRRVRKFPQEEWRKVA